MERSGKRVVIWMGREDPGDQDDTRIIAVDLDSNDPLPCQLIVEYLRKDGLGEDYWVERSASSDMVWLEKKLVLELADKIGSSPEWAQDARTDPCPVSKLPEPEPKGEEEPEEEPEDELDDIDMGSLKHWQEPEPEETQVTQTGILTNIWRWLRQR